MYPIILEFGFITVFSLWFFVAIGYVAGTLTILHLSKRTRVRLDAITDNSLPLFIGTLLASRLLFVILHPELYFYRFHWTALLNVLKIWDKGLSFWGAIAGLMVGIWYFSRREGESPLRLLDLITPGIFIGMFFGNIGAFLDGINFGVPTNLPWGISFRSANVKYIAPIHPTQLYSALATLLLGLGGIELMKKIRGALPGFIAELGLFAFSLFQFIEEFVRGDETIKIFSVRLPQLMAAVGIFAGGYLIFQRFTNRHGGDPHGLLKGFFADLVTRVKKFRTRNPESISTAPTPCQNQIG